MSAPAFESVSAVTHPNTDATVTITKPTGVVSGRLMVAVLGWGNRTLSSAPSGWTLAASNTGAFFKTVAYWKIAGGSEPASYDWVFSGTVSAVGAILHYSGAHATTPVDDADAGNSTSTASWDAPTSTTTGADRTIVRGVAYDAVRTLTFPSGPTSRVDQKDSGSSLAGLGVSEESQASAGNTATRTWTWNSTTTPAGVTIAIAPAAGGGGTTYNDSLGLAATAGFTRANNAAFGGSLGLAASSGFSDGGQGSLVGSVALPATSAEAHFASLDRVGSLALGAASGLAQSAGLDAAGSLALGATSALGGATDAALVGSVALGAVSDFLGSLGGAVYSLSVGLGATSAFARSAGLDAAGSLGLGAEAGYGGSPAGSSFGCSASLAAAAGFARSGTADFGVSLALTSTTAFAAADSVGAPFIPSPDLRACLVAYLSGDAELLELVSGAIYPGAPPEDAAYPNMAYRVLTETHRYHLRGAIGCQIARVELAARSRRMADCVEIKKRWDALLDGFIGTWSGLRVRWCGVMPNSPHSGDSIEPAADGSKDQIHVLHMTYRVKYDAPSGVVDLVTV